MDLRISTITVVYDLGSKINLSKLIKKTNPDRQLLKIKWGKTLDCQKSFFQQKPKKNKKTQKLDGGDSSGSEGGRKKRKKENLGKFYNQVTIEINTGLKFKDKSGTLKDNINNVMIFKNGKIKIAGCKSRECAVRTIQILIKKINKSGVVMIKTKDFKGVLVDKSNQVYSSSGNNFGYINKNIVTSKRKGDRGKLFMYNTEKPAIIRDSFIIDETYNSDLVKNIYNKNGEVIGRKYIEFLDKEYENYTYVNKDNSLHTSFEVRDIKNSAEYIKKRIKLFIGKKYEKDTEEREEYGEKAFGIYKKYGGLIGREKVVIDSQENKNKVVKNKGYIVTEYSIFEKEEDVCKDPITIGENIQICMINSDFDCGYKFDAFGLIDILTNEHNLFTSYDPDEYPGVKSWFYPSGECSCMKIKCKCKITIICFPSGKILITGVKSFEDLRYTYMFISKLFKERKDDILREICE